MPALLGGLWQRPWSLFLEVSWAADENSCCHVKSSSLAHSLFVQFSAPYFHLYRTFFLGFKNWAKDEAETAAQHLQCVCITERWYLNLCSCMSSELTSPETIPFPNEFGLIGRKYCWRATGPEFRVDLTCHHQSWSTLTDNEDLISSPPPLVE